MLPWFTITNMTYNHTQHGPWHYLLFALTLATLGGAWPAASRRLLTCSGR